MTVYATPLSPKFMKDPNYDPEEVKKYSFNYKPIEIYNFPPLSLGARIMAWDSAFPEIQFGLCPIREVKEDHEESVLESSSQNTDSLDSFATLSDDNKISLVHSERVLEQDEDDFNYNEYDDFTVGSLPIDIIDQYSIR